VLEQAREALRDSPRIDASRIELADQGDALLVVGEVATPEEASAAELVVGRFAEQVVNRLRVDPGVREGVDEDAPAERIQPTEDEVLVGSTDMLAGPDSTISGDVSRALEENEPWDPPDEPQLAGTAAEHSRNLSEGDQPLEADPAPTTLPEDVPTPDPRSTDALGSTSGTESEAYRDHGHASEGRGAVGEGTLGEGSTSGEAATETGARGADTRAADPVRRGTGGSASDSATERGPESDEDPALREDLPSEGPPD
jgi:hypothetical protein